MSERTDYERFEAADRENRQLLREEELCLEVTETFCKVLREQNISRSELARRMGKSKALVSQLLSGRRNFTLRTVADMAEAVNCMVHVSLVEKLQSARVIHQGPWTAARFEIVSTGEEPKQAFAGDRGGAA